MDTAKTYRMLEVEAEFGAPLQDVIRDLREVGGGSTWRTVAGILGISRNTLREWRRTLGLGVGKPGDGGRTDPLSYPHGVHTKSLEHRAIEAGYESGTDWVLELRLRRGLSCAQAADVLGVHPETISRYTPVNMRGCVEDWR